MVSVVSNTSSITDIVYTLNVYIITVKVKFKRLLPSDNQDL